MIILAVVPGVLFAGVADASAARAPKMFHGVMWDRGAMTASPEVQSAQWRLMGRSGVESVRVVFPWSAVQPTPGGPDDFAETDALVERATRNGIGLLPVVLYAPEWARKYPLELTSPPAHPADYAAFMRRLVERYGPRGSFWAEHSELPRRPLREWQIWNEPHFDWYWYTPEGEDWVPGYVAVLRRASRAIRRADPGARVVLTGFADACWDHLERVLSAGARGAFDVAAIHVFTRNPSFVIETVRLVRRVLERHRLPRMPIWVTETTFPAGKGDIPPPEDEWRRQWYTTDSGMARRLARVYALGRANARALRLRRIYWYTWGSSYTGDDLFDYSGLVRVRDGELSRQPALRAYRRAARH